MHAKPSPSQRVTLTFYLFIRHTTIDVSHTVFDDVTLPDYMIMYYFPNGRGLRTEPRGSPQLGRAVN